MTGPFVFAQLSLELDLLLSLLEADRLQDLLCGRRRRSCDERQRNQNRKQLQRDLFLHNRKR